MVGIDGSGASTKALKWAARNGHMFGPIQPVSTFHLPWWTVLFPPPVLAVGPEAELKREQITIAERAVAALPLDRIEVPIVCRGLAGPTLCSVSASSELLVVGTRSRGATADAILGSVSMYCLRHSKVPVAIVPDSADPTSDLRDVVVGVDGSEGSISALVWALAHVADGGRVRALRVWTFYDPPMEDGTSTQNEQPEEWELERANASIQKAIDRYRKRYGTDSQKSVEIIPAQVLGHPSNEIARMASGSQTVVVGAPHLKGLKRALGTSVAAMLGHAPDQVLVVVPEGWEQ